MYPLLEIKTVPIEIEMKTTHAKLEYARGTAELEISKTGGDLSIKSRPIKINIDTYEMRNSITPTPGRAAEVEAQEGHQAAYEATALYAQQGRLLLRTRIGEELVTKFAADAQTRDLKLNAGIQFLPKVGPDVSWEGGEVRINYQLEQLDLDWQLNGPQFTFTPGDIEISVTQRPQVMIEYVGGPLYVPPSVDPAYEEE